ncbi:MAG: site-specific integrase [Bacillota bacterium]|nr:site-specific integrase [Bacillota bacterium]
MNSYEQIALLKQPNPKAPTGLRNLCLLILMLKAGLRVNEVLNLKVEDIDWEKGCVHVSGSGAALERSLVLDDSEMALLRRLSESTERMEGYMFTTLDGKKLKDRYIREMVKRLSKKAGITKDVYPHLLRYTFAVDFMRETRDVKLLQKALGHRDPSATQAYANLLFEELKGDQEGEKRHKRSGMPLSEPYVKKVVHDDNVQLRVFEDEKGEGMPEPDPIVYERTFEEQITASGSIDTNKPETEPEANEYIPTLEIETEPEREERIAIPPLKCSNCNYILHYQGNCPKCGTSFNEILMHWGKKF